MCTRSDVCRSLRGRVKRGDSEILNTNKHSTRPGRGAHLGPAAACRGASLVRLLVRRLSYRNCQWHGNSADDNRDRDRDRWMVTELGCQSRCSTRNLHSLAAAVPVTLTAIQ